MSDTLSFILRYCQGKKLACDWEQRFLLACMQHMCYSTGGFGAQQVMYANRALQKNGWICFCWAHLRLELIQFAQTFGQACHNFGKQLGPLIRLFSVWVSQSFQCFQILLKRRWHSGVLGSIIVASSTCQDRKCESKRTIEDCMGYREEKAFGISPCANPRYGMQPFGLTPQQSCTPSWDENLAFKRLTHVQLHLNAISFGLVLLLLRVGSLHAVP